MTSLSLLVGMTVVYLLNHGVSSFMKVLIKVHLDFHRTLMHKGKSMYTSDYAFLHHGTVVGFVIAERTCFHNWHQLVIGLFPYFF